MIEEKLCTEKHKNIEDKFENHQKRLDKYSDGLMKATQTYLEKNI